MDCIPKKGEIPRGIPADVWALVQAAPDIIVEQYRQKGANLAVAIKDIIFFRALQPPPEPK